MANVPPSKRRMLDVGVSLGKATQVKLNPLKLTDDHLSNVVIGTHDSQATRYDDVGSLYNVAANIISSTNNLGHLDLKHPKSVELVEDKVPRFMPNYSTLKGIACQMTCNSFNALTAHETMMGILEKLRSYTWDAKAVIALAAFALDYGESWRLSLMMQAPTKGNSLELHVFRLAGEDKPNQTNADLITTLVDRTLKLIHGIIELEKLLANKNYSKKDVPALYAAPRNLYTYWAIFALLACASFKTDSAWDIISELVQKITLVLSRLKKELKEINEKIELLKDYIWRTHVFQTPSGILELLKALIFPTETKQPEIFDNMTGTLVSPELLMTQNLLLFISGLDNIDDEIWVLKSIHDSFRKDKEKQDFRILWIPVVYNWNAEDQKKFESLKSKMPWYVVNYNSLIKGIKPLEEEWHYQRKPIVVVTNPQGKIINKNALHMMFVWGIKAFPFRPEDGEELSQHSNWFWNALTKVNPDVGKWIQEDKFIFIYGGTDIVGTQRFGTLLDTFKKDSVIKQADASIEHFNLAKVDTTNASKFWESINNTFLDKIDQKVNFQQDEVLKDIEALLSVKNESGWALLSRGVEKVVLDYDPLMTTVVEEFEEWKNKVTELQGFDKAFSYYYDLKRKVVPRHCSQFQLDNIRSAIPKAICCPDASCEHRMEISVIYKCCHGSHSTHVTENNAGNHTPLPKARLNTP